jgi:Skp family chaperone for outer membrane proteins
MKFKKIEKKYNTYQELIKKIEEAVKEKQDKLSKEQVAVNADRDAKILKLKVKFASIIKLYNSNKK